MSTMNSGSRSIAASVTSKDSSSGRNAMRIRFSWNFFVSRIPVSTANSEVSLCWPSTINCLATPSFSPPPTWRTLASAPVSQHQRSHRIAAIHRVEQVTYLRRRPDEGTLDIGQSLAVPYLLNQVGERVPGVAVDGGHDDLPSWLQERPEGYRQPLLAAVPGRPPLGASSPLTPTGRGLVVRERHGRCARPCPLDGSLDEAHGVRRHPGPLSKESHMGGQSSRRFDDHKPLGYVGAGRWSPRVGSSACPWSGTSTGGP